MSIEGMWCFVSGDTFTASMDSGGVVVLDTQKVYGGDSVMAYLGRYEIQGGRVTGEVETFRYNPSVEGVDVFGDEMGPVRQTHFDLALNEKGFLVGVLKRGANELPIVLQKLRSLT